MLKAGTRSFCFVLGDKTYKVYYNYGPPVEPCEEYPCGCREEHTLEKIIECSSQEEVNFFSEGHIEEFFENFLYSSMREMMNRELNEYVI